ncbi:Acp32CD [Drosophila busckii]|uniref:Acp32CD n=1 Tax=Drosophila busckii TaxID=30019 RepID=A0A0M5J656_DROBS|nr:accessory gland protein Acp32CD [Drosophila busckii]ALC39224.1 Acp32CD [Drosophila busckii]
MRARLSIRIVALCLVLWQLQAATVMGQKYYMNFAFNNNNPDGTSADNGGDKAPGLPGGEVPDAGSNGESGANGSGGDANASSKDSSDNDEKSGSGGGGGSGSGGGDKSKEDGSGENSGDTEKADDNPGRDDDDDDSDSHDPSSRREKIRQAEEEGEKGPDGDHSHHSSYEISIDDSFGGRYVRSIYESSESHGHSGSVAGSGSGGRDKVNEDSSAGEAPGGAPNAEQKTFGANDYEEYNGDA